MLTPLERVNHLLADLRFAQVDFDTLYPGGVSEIVEVPET